MPFDTRDIMIFGHVGSVVRNYYARAEPTKEAAQELLVNMTSETSAPHVRVSSNSQSEDAQDLRLALGYRSMMSCCSFIGRATH